MKRLLERLKQRISRITRPEKNPREQLLHLMPKNSICAEIGVWKGEFSKKILMHVTPSMLHLIDPWEYQTGFGKRLYGGTVAQSQTDMDTIYRQVVDEFAKSSGVKIHRAFSDAASSIFPDEYFDWVYVDGNHYYDYVLSDLRNYAPKIKTNGFLTGDDYFWTSVELNGDRPVLRAVDEFLKGNESFTLVKIIGSQFILKKRA